MHSSGSGAEQVQYRKILYICRCREKASPSNLGSRTHMCSLVEVGYQGQHVDLNLPTQRRIQVIIWHTTEKIPARVWRKERKWNERGMKKGSRLASVLLFVGSHKHTLRMKACTLSVSIYISDFIHISTFISPAWRVQRQLKDGWANTCVKNSRSCL